MTNVVLTLAGPDRPGLVSRLSAQIAAHGGSWMESRLAHLAGRFTGIVLASVAESEIEGLRAALAAMAVDGLEVSLHRAGAVDGVAPEAVLTLSVVCQDRPGIIRDITRVLAASHVNIDELSTDVHSGSFSGEKMFHAEARLRLPQGVGLDDVRRDLEQLGNELMVDVQLSEPRIPA